MAGFTLIQPSKNINNLIVCMRGKKLFFFTNTHESLRDQLLRWFVSRPAVHPEEKKTRFKSVLFGLSDLHRFQSVGVFRFKLGALLR